MFLNDFKDIKVIKVLNDLLKEGIPSILQKGSIFAFSLPSGRLEGLFPCLFVFSQPSNPCVFRLQRQNLPQISKKKKCIF
jgi:hypothetical protein